ncbi:hypothetical protein WN48_05491 [Eufriesea mexicana]|uniref:Uncharacterized protein n=1 Tax=Eufriesea mexicana TaxID=516756 RepID=A0A310STE3_9HYME|nr:hypothetical protein WN48_05491 [Eufriesea mexicana]
MSLAVTDLPELIAYPENATTCVEIEVMQRMLSEETIGSENRNQVSTPVSVNILQHSVSKSVDAFDDLENRTIFYDNRSFKAVSSKTSLKNYMPEITAKLSHEEVKPPNVIIYADSLIARNNVKSVLEESLGTDKENLK